MNWTNLQYVADFSPVPSTPSLTSGKTLFSRYLLLIIKLLCADQSVQVDMYFLAIITATSCDHFYKGCTKNYKDKIGKIIGRAGPIKSFCFRQRVDNWKILRSNFL